MNRTDRFAILWLAAAGLNSAQLAQGELVAHWPLNEGAGEVFEDVVGDFDGFLPIADFEEKAEIEWSGEGPPHQENAVEFLGTNSFIATNFPGIGIPFASLRFLRLLGCATSPSPHLNPKQDSRRLHPLCVPKMLQSEDYFLRSQGSWSQ